MPGIARGEKAAPEHDRGALWIAAAPGAEANSAHVMGFRSGVPAGESAPSWSCSFPRERKGDRSQRRLDDLQVEQVTDDDLRCAESVRVVTLITVWDNPRDPHDAPDERRDSYAGKTSDGADKKDRLPGQGFAA